MSETTAWEKLPAIEGKHGGCLNCGPRPSYFPADGLIAVGFGYAALHRAGARPVDQPVGRLGPEREWLEKAAIAAGIEGRYFDGSSAVHTGIYRAKHRYYWNPLASDSEAFRLAAALNFDVCINICFVEVVWVDMDRSETFNVSEDWGAADVDLGDRMEYIRRAIVRMAAKVADHKAPNAEVTGLGRNRSSND